MVGNRTWGGWLRKLLSLMLGILVAAHIVRGIQYADALTLLLVDAVLSLLNSLLLPFLTSLFLFISLPLVISTFGLVIPFVLWLVNALLLYLSSVLVPTFHVDGALSALFGSLVVSIISHLLLALTGGNGKGRPRPPKTRQQRPRNEYENGNVMDA